MCNLGALGRFIGLFFVGLLFFESRKHNRNKPTSFSVLYMSNHFKIFSHISFGTQNLGRIPDENNNKNNNKICYCYCHLMRTGAFVISAHWCVLWGHFFRWFVNYR